MHVLGCTIILSTFCFGIYGFKIQIGLDFFPDKSSKAENEQKLTPEQFNEKTDTVARNSEDGLLTVLKNIPLGCPVILNCQNKLLTFHLYTRSMTDNSHILDLANPHTIENAPFEKDSPLKFIVHEYWGGKDSILNLYLRTEYFKRGNYNIVAVDYEMLVKYTFCYPVATASLSTVGKCAAKVLDAVYKAHPTFSPDITHVIAFSFGAHVSNWASASLQTGTIARLTLLEPALPFYDKTSNQIHHQRIEARASFTDVYHTNIGICSFRNPIGDVDVYFNNGVRQPGCNCNNSCDHLRVVDYFSESITSEIGMWGFPCSGWQGYLEGDCNVEEVMRLGEHISKRTRGVYYVFTGSESPYLLPASAYTNEDITEQVDVKCKFDQVYDIMQED